MSSETSSIHSRRSSLQCNNSLQQLFRRITQEVEEKDPNNVIFFIVDFLCKHYPHHLNGFASVWNGDPELEKERIQVIQFFRFQKIPIDIASDFTNVGFDTLETLCTITPESLAKIEELSEGKWLPGHRVRLQQTFSDICNRVRAFRQEKEKLFHLSRLSSGHCDHNTVVTRTNALNGSLVPAKPEPSTLPRFQRSPNYPVTYTVTPPNYSGFVVKPQQNNTLPFLTASLNCN